MFLRKHIGSSLVKVSSVLLNLYISIKIAEILSKDDFGVYISIVSSSFLIGNLINFGQSIFLIKSYNLCFKELDQSFSNSFYLIVITIFILSVPLYMYNKNVFYISSCWSIMILIEAYLKLRYNFLLSSFYLYIIPLLLFISFLFFSNLNLDNVLFYYLASYVITLLISLPLINLKTLLSTNVININFIKLLKSSLIFVLNSSVQIFNNNFIIYFLTFLGLHSLIADYYIALKFAGVVNILHLSTNMYINKDIQINFKKNKLDIIEKKIFFSCCFNILFALIYSLLFLFCGNQFIHFLFGENYSLTITLFILVLIPFIINISFGPCGTLLNLCNLHRNLLYISLFCSLIMISLTFCLYVINDFKYLFYIPIISILLWNCYIALIIYKKYNIFIGLTCLFKKVFPEN